MARPRAAASIAEILQALAAAPARIAEMTAGLPASGLKTAPEPGWSSVVEILAHLRACSDVWGDHIAAILAEKNPSRRGVSARRWIKDKDYASLEFATSMRAYASQRAGLLGLLCSLPEADWARYGTIVSAGKPLVYEVRFYANKLFEHERPHLKQIESTVEAIGARR